MFFIVGDEGEVIAFLHGETAEEVIVELCQAVLVTRPQHDVGKLGWAGGLPASVVEIDGHFGCMYGVLWVSVLATFIGPYTNVVVSLCFYMWSALLFMFSN